MYTSCVYKEISNEFISIVYHSLKQTRNPTDQLLMVTSPTAFQSLYMALAIDITYGRGLSNEARRELLLK